MQRLCLRQPSNVIRVHYEDSIGADLGDDAGDTTDVAKLRRSRNSRCNSHRFIASCTTTAAAEIYQIHRRLNPGVCDNRMTGTPMMTMRDADVISDGIVLPIAWNMLELTKTMPEKTKLNAMMWRYSAPTAITCGSEEKIPTMASEASQTSNASTNIAAAASTAPVRNVARTRSAFRAPKFCPATGLTAKPSATTGRKHAWMMRMPMPKPACAAAPNGRLTT